MLAVFYEQPSSFMGSHPNLRVVVLVCGQLSLFVGVHLRSWAFILVSGHLSLCAVACIHGQWPLFVGGDGVVVVW